MPWFSTLTQALDKTCSRDSCRSTAASPWLPETDTVPYATPTVGPWPLGPASQSAQTKAVSAQEPLADKPHGQIPSHKQAQLAGDEALGWPQARRGQHGAGQSTVLLQMWWGHSPVYEGRTWALCDPGATSRPWPGSYKETSQVPVTEELTQVKPQDSGGPAAWPTQGSLQGLVYLVLQWTQRNPCVYSWQLRADQRCRDGLGPGSCPPGQRGPSAHTPTPTGTPRAEVVPGYPHQPLLPITRHQLFDRCSNDNLGSERDWKFLISSTWELSSKASKLPFYLYSFSHVVLNTSWSTYLTDDHKKRWQALHMLINSK